MDVRGAETTTISRRDELSATEMTLKIFFRPQNFLINNLRMKNWERARKEAEVYSMYCSLSR
jgi:hypothetical protein